VDLARERLQKLIGARDPKEVIFTSGGTESINLALKGVAEMYREKGTHIVTTAIEHHAILHTAHFLQTQGYEVTTVPVDCDGLVSPDDISAALTDRAPEPAPGSRTRREAAPRSE